jgi:hypothetical protein
MRLKKVAMSLLTIRFTALDFRFATDLFGWVSLVCKEGLPKPTGFIQTMVYLPRDNISKT